MRSAFVAPVLLALLCACSSKEDPKCPEGTPTSCGDACADLQTSRQNCGACGTTCGDGSYCVDGACQVVCSAGLTSVEGSCVNLLTDSRNCGTAGNACPSGQVCSEGACGATCAAGLAACAGGCANLLIDTNNCGACGTTCDDQDACWKGSCQSACNGFPTTDGKPVMDMVAIGERGARSSYLAAVEARRAGINLVFRGMDFFDMLDIIFDPNRKAGIEGFDLFGLSWAPATPSPLTSLLECGNDLNLMGWCNADYMAAMAAYRTQLNPVERAASLKAAQEIFVEEAPMSVLGYPTEIFAVPAQMQSFDGIFLGYEAYAWSGVTDLRGALTTELGNFNPLFSTSYERFMHGVVFERLFDLNVDAQSPAGYLRPVGQLAQDVPGMVATGNGTEHTLTLDLRQSSFSDGHPVDAYDVAFTWQLNWVSSIGSQFRSRWTALGLTEDSLVVVDADTLRFTFPGPAPEYFYDFLFAILPMHYWVPHASVDAATAYAGLFDASGDYTGPVPSPGEPFDTGVDTFGSGPYKAHPTGLWDPVNQVLKMVRNPLSSQPTRGVNTITYEVMSPEEVRTLLGANEPLLVPSDFWLTAEDFTGVTGSRPHIQKTLAYFFDGFNIQSPTVSDKRVRRAYDLIQPREAYTSLMSLGGLGSTWLSTVHPNFTPEFGVGGANGPRYDVAEARSLMREAGFTSVDPTADTLMSKQAILCNAAQALEGWTADGLIDGAETDRILSDLARYTVGR